MIEESVLNEYFTLLKFQSISSDPTKLKDCADCAVWLKSWLKPLGFKTDLIMPPIKNSCAAPPILFAEREGSSDAPTVLFYGHYDVQPVDPIDLWSTPPFEPTIINNRVYARGANDDKGQFFSFLCGLRDYLATAPSKTPTIKILLEGQEESGSGALIALAPEMRRQLAADILAVCDTSAANDLQPAIIAGLRGVSHFTLRLKGPNRDLHSGEYGGIAPNPAQAMTKLLASLHTPTGAIAVDGFYDGIEAPSSEEIAEAEKSSLSAEQYLNDFGCEAVGGEEGKSPARRNSFEPTIEINGIHSGYGGNGAKTIIPSEAVAKISMRLVPGQTPQRAFEDVKNHLLSQSPRGMTMIFEDWTSGAGGFRLPLSSPIFRLATEALKELDARGPVFQWCGASIPVISILREVSLAAPLMVGWGQSTDRIHSPNENYSFAQFEKSRAWAKKFFEHLNF